MKIRALAATAGGVLVWWWWCGGFVIDEATLERVLGSVSSQVRVDRPTLTWLLADRPDVEAVLPLLSLPAEQVVRAGVVYLGLYGTLRESPLLVLCLQHEDDGVAELAEQCLWSIWMQAGSESGNGALVGAIGRIRQQDYQLACEELEQLTEDEPAFAEAHFQLGITLSFLERDEAAAAAYRSCLRLNPYHFAAAAAMGHNCIQQGNLGGALHYYRRSLHIHPRQEDVREAVRELEMIAGPGCGTA